MVDVESLRKLDENWFFEHSAVKDPAEACQRFRDYLKSTRTRDPNVHFSKLLQMAGGVGRGAIQLYLSPTEWEQLGDHTLWDLDHICQQFQVHIPPRPPRPTRTDSRGTRRIALLCDFTRVPSPRFHIEVLRGLVIAGQAQHFAVAIHAVSADDPDLPTQLERIIRLDHPEGIIWFRLTPDDAAVDLLRCRHGIPAVVVHGDLRDYPPPVLGHVFPDQARLAEQVAEWGRAITDGIAAEKEVVVVAMPMEASGPRSLRNERITSVEAGLRLAGLTVRRVEVPDYAADHAQSVCHAFPCAAGFVCLSDEIAVAVAQLLAAKGRAARVLGFDDSVLAGRHGVPSISQSLEEIGTRTWDLFTEFFRRPDPSVWPASRPSPVALTLSWQNASN